jgi:anthranilate 1,2-dioxygenase reductase subunit
MQAKILENKELGRGNRWLKLHILGELPLDHEPGTVLGLSMRHGQGTLRHAYTVSRADAKLRTLEFLYRVIPEGRMTPHLAALPEGSDILIAGRGGHPISLEVDTAPKGIVLASTGTGIGPLYGFSQMALGQGLQLPLTLFAGFREEADMSLSAELDALASAHPNFTWHASLSKPGPHWTGLKGHITQSMAQVLGPVRDLHFHLVGNGDMVVELYKILMEVGLQDERVTSEIYFNYQDDPDMEKIRALAAKFTY